MTTTIETVELAVLPSQNDDPALVFYASENITTKSLGGIDPDSYDPIPGLDPLVEAMIGRLNSVREISYFMITEHTLTVYLITGLDWTSLREQHVAAILLERFGMSELNREKIYRLHDLDEGLAWLMDHTRS